MFFLYVFYTCQKTLETYPNQLYRLQKHGSEGKLLHFFQWGQ